MSEALNFVSNQAGALPNKRIEIGSEPPAVMDSMSFFDIITRVKAINRINEKKDA